MDEVLIKYNNLKQELNKYKKIIYKIETDLIDMEKELADFDNIKVLDKLVLNEQQKEIVESEEKNMLVIACPGSGKTHTLISKYIYLTVKNIIPKVSNTELIALRSGTVSIDRDIFQGKVILPQYNSKFDNFESYFNNFNVKNLLKKYGSEQKI